MRLIRPIRPIFFLLSAFLAAGILIFLFSYFSKSASAAWLDEDWNYRKAIAITNAGSAQTDYQVAVTLDTSTSLIPTGKMQSDCDDIRAADSNGHSLSFWLEPNTCNTTTTKVWVKVSSIPTTGATVYIYYGNPVASSTSSTTNTFIREITNVQGAWTMDETSDGTGAVTRNDSSGNSNNLTDNNTVPSGTGKYSNGGNFTTANSEYLSITDASQTGLDIGSTYSLEAWINPTLSSCAIYCTIMAKWLNNGNLSYQFSLGDFGNGDVRFRTTSNGWAGGGISISSAAGLVSMGSLTHLILTSDGTTVRLYKNGSEVTSGNFPYTGNGTAPNTTDPFTIGGAGNNGSPNDFFGGVVDETRVYNKVLSASEITDIYNNYGYTTTNYANKELVRKRASTEPSAGTAQNEETGPAKPRLYLAFNEGQGTSANDSSGQSNTGTLAGATTPSWQTGDLCISGTCLYFNGSTASVTVANTVSNAQTISFWVRPATTTQYLIDLDGGTHYISASSGTITATGFSSPTIYVNGKVSSTLTANQWNFIEVTTATSFNASAIKVGNVTTNYLTGFVDEVKMYDYARTAAQVKADFNARGSVKGVSAQMGGGDQKYLSEGLVGYWKLEESSTPSVDSSGNGNSGTWSGSPAAGTGKYGNGISLNGSSFASVTDNSSIKFGTGDFTMSTWIKPNSTSNLHVMGKDTFDGGNTWVGYFLQIYNSKITFATRNYVSGSGPTNSLNSNASVSTGTWLHVVGVKRSGVLYLYLNGALDNTLAETSSTNTDNNVNFKIGKFDQAGSWYFNGIIDEARLYNRALTPSEVEGLYQWAPGPVGYWSFEEGSGTSTFDTSGNGNNGTLGGGTADYRPTWTSGKYGKGLSFDGVNDYVTPSSPTILDDLTNGDFTAEFWYYETYNSQSSYINFINKDDGLDGMGWKVLKGSGIGSNIYFNVYYSTTNLAATSIVTPSLNIWNHIAVVYNKSLNRGYVFINGIESSNKTDGVGTLPSDAGRNIEIGRPNGGNFYNNFLGKMDDVKIYNYARTPSQILADMGTGQAQKQPVGYWKFDEGYLTTAHDSTPNANDLTLSAASWTNSGKFGKAFTGATNTRLTKTDDSDFDFAAADDLTLSTWFKRDTVSNAEYLIHKQTGNIGYGLWMDSDGDIVFGIGDTGGTAFPEESIGGSLSKNYDDNAWHHALATKTGTNNIKLYVDGKEIASDTSLAVAGTLENAAKLIIGDANETDGTDEFLGTIDELKIYRYALTADEVKTEYNRGSSMVLGAAGNNSTYAAGAANQEYCVPGDTTSCAAPVGEWKMEGNLTTGAAGTVADSSTSGNNLTSNRFSGNYPVTNIGKIGKAFDPSSGTSDHNRWAAITDAAQSGVLDQTGAMTVMGWVSINSATCSNENAFVSKGLWAAVASSTTQEGFELAVSNATGSVCRPQFFVSSDGTYANRIYTSVLSGANLSANTWYHIAGVYTGSKLQVYLNGLLYTSMDYSAGIYNNTGNFTIGGMHYAGGGSLVYDFNGKIDEVKIYNYARTPAQIAWDFNKGAPVAYWDFDECSGSSVNDLSGNSRTGTITIGGSGEDTVGTCTTGSTAWGDGATGKINSSLKLDGIDDFITTAAFSPLSTAAQTTTTFSWGGWFYPTTSVASKTLLEKATEFQLTTDANSMPICGVYYTGAFHNSTAPTTALTLSAWNHILCTYDGTNINTYLNGKLIQQTAETTAVTAASSVLYMGETSGATNEYEGQLDDVKIFNYALTGSQVKLLMNNGAINFGPVTGSP